MNNDDRMTMLVDCVERHLEADGWSTEQLTAMRDPIIAGLYDGLLAMELVAGR